MMKRKIKWRWVIITSLIFIAFIIFVLPKVSEYSSRAIGVMDSPDTSLIYSGKDLYNTAKSYGQEGRNIYIKLRWTFDLAWPIVYTLFLASWIIKLSEYISRGSKNKTIKYLFLLPIIAMFFDFLENIGATIVMTRYPLQSSIIATITPVMTLLKWLTLSGSFLILMVLILISILIKVRTTK